MNSTRVGFAGMGIMGSAMAMNLVKAGFAVTVWNRTPTSPRLAAVRQSGAAVADSPRQLGVEMDVVCLCVSRTEDVEQVIFGPDGLASAARPGLVIIDHSTIDPGATRRMAAELAGRNITLLDAPISGGQAGAEAGTLSIMVGGDEAAFERCRPILAAMGKNITRIGEAGAGQACKACNQVAVVCALMGVCEAVALAEKQGIDAGRMLLAVGAGAGGSVQLSALGPKILAGDFAPGFMIDLVLKDLGIVASAKGELALRGTAAASAYFQELAERGGGKLGTQALIEAVRAFAVRSVLP